LKDVVLVPKTLSTLIIRRGGDPAQFKHGMTNELSDLIEEAPIVSLYVFVIQHTLGWFGYLLLNVSGQKYPDRNRFCVNHFNPTSPLFTRKQYNEILLSDLGVALTFLGLVFASRTWGFLAVLHYYLLPYFWVNYWLVLITYLQHTDPALPHYRGATWSFQRGAAATMDRDFGFIGQHIFHDILKVHPEPITLIDRPTWHTTTAPVFLFITVGTQPKPSAQLWAIIIIMTIPISFWLHGGVRECANMWMTRAMLYFFTTSMDWGATPGSLDKVNRFDNINRK